MGCRAVTELETQKNLFEFPYFAEKGKTNFLAVQTPFAFRHHLLALLGKVTTAGDGPVGSIQQFLSFQAKRLTHRALPPLAGGSAIGLSATDAYGTVPRPVMQVNYSGSLWFPVRTGGEKLS